MDTIRVKHNTQTKAISSEVSDATVKKASLFLDEKTDREYCVVFLALLRILSMGLTTGAHGGQSVSCDLF
jgi:hypothetical protein